MPTSSGTILEKGLFDFIFSACKCKCGIPNRRPRVIGGEQIQMHEFPWSSIIHLTENSEKQVAGTIINNKYVLTAASQILGVLQIVLELLAKSSTPYGLKITIGHYDRCLPDRSSLNVSVDRIIIHPEFSERTRAHDLALIRLSTPITFEKGVSPICLATPSTQYLGQVATLFGWPQEHNKNSNCVPRKLGLPILDFKSCLLNLNNQTDDLAQDKGCVGVIGLRSPVCSDDAGGPVMFRSYRGVYELIGIWTDYNDCRLESNMAYYSKINDHLAWITENTRDSCYCFKT